MTAIDAIRRADLLAPADIARFARPGHFAYPSGYHGDLWLALELLVADPRRLRRAAAALAAKLRPAAPTLVCGPLLGGALVGLEVAAVLALPFVYAEPPTPTNPTALLPSALRHLLPGARVAIVDDAINAGADTLATLAALEATGAHVVAVAALLARHPAAIPPLTQRGLAVASLVSLSWNTWPAPDCPLCRSGVPITPP